MISENNQSEETQNAAEPAETTETQEQEAPAANEDVETQESETPDDGAANDNSEGEADGKEPLKADDKHKRQGGWQRKIERLERQNQLLTEQLSVIRPTQQPAPGQQERTPDEKAADWVKGLVDKEIEAREQFRRQQDAQARFQQRTSEVRAKHPDFDDVLLSAEVPVSPALSEALLTSDHGPEIMYQLASNPAELARLSALPPLAAAREIGRLEAKVSSTPAPKSTTKPATRPPAPPTNVNGSTSSTRNLDDLPISEYKRAFRSGRR
jgi:hypothetical protein